MNEAKPFDTTTTDAASEAMNRIFNNLVAGI
jgi:hypothetical protein